MPYARRRLQLGRSLLSPAAFVQVTMLRNVTAFTIVAAAALSSAAARADDMPRSCYSLSANAKTANNVDAPASDLTAGSLCVQGGPAAVRLEVHQTSIATVLTALSTVYKITCRNSIALNQTRDGTFAGTLREVISRVLNGYNFVITQNNAHLDVIIVDKAKQAATAPVVTNVSEQREQMPQKPPSAWSRSNR
jgi:hypothetical protein